MKRFLALFLALSLTMGITACGSNKTSDKDDKSDKKTTTTAVESVSDTTVESVSEDSTTSKTNNEDDSHDQESELPSKGEAGPISFLNGNKFKCSEYDVILYNYDTTIPCTMYTINIPDSEYKYLITATTNHDVAYTELADAVANELKESYNVTPFIDIHDEGTYITGILEDRVMLTFIANDNNSGTTYSLRLDTDDSDNCIDILNSIIDDFLASGITDNEYRTEYGEKVDSGNRGNDDSSKVEPITEGFPKINVPSDYKCTYSSEYTLSYENEDKYSITFKTYQDEDLLDFLTGGSDQYLESYTLKEYGSHKSSVYGTLHIIEAKSNKYDNMYKYYAITMDGTVTTELGKLFGDKMSIEECKGILADFFE